MEDFLYRWQDLIGNIVAGIFTLTAGALIFLEGGRQLAHKNRQDEHVRLEILKRLESKCDQLRQKIEEASDLISDYVENETDRGSAAPPEWLHSTRAFDVILSQAAGKNLNPSLISHLSDLTELLGIYEGDFHRFRQAFGGDVVPMAAVQGQLSFLANVRDPTRQRAIDNLQTSTDSALRMLNQLDVDVKDALASS